MQAVSGLAMLDRLSALWPLPALLAWACGWTVLAGLQQAGAPATAAAVCGCAAAALWALIGGTRMRRWVVALGFPISWLASEAASLSASLPGWAWLLPLGLLALAYPLGTWRDAPLFPTPDGALDALATQVPLAAGARVLDAGCGLGHGLAALRRAYPQAQLFGIERSWPIAWAARFLCRRASIDATVHCGDMWAGDWRGHTLVYLFQRPESLPRAVEKARAQLERGAWLASLEFPALALAPQVVITCPDGRALWLYQAPFVAAGAAASFTASGVAHAAQPFTAALQRR